MARKMKDSGIAWIGDIPEGWEITKIKYGVIKVGSGKTPSGGAEVYTDSGVLFLRSQNVYDCALVLDNPTYISYETDATMKSTRVLPNDVLLNITGASIGRCCVVPETLGAANVNQHVCIIRTDSSFFLPKFMQYFWVSHLGRYAISLFQTGGNREGLSFDAIRSTPIPYLSISEQSKIVTYLDSECSRIDAMLTKTHASIEEYKKLKQAVITQAVTKGVRGEREMKDSGVEWIGEIPKEWSVSKIKRLHCGLTDGTHGTYNRVESGYILLSSKNVRDNGIKIGTNESYISEFDFKSITSNGFPQKNDLLLCCIGASIGRCALYEFEESMAFQRSVIFIRCNDKILPKMMLYNLRSNHTLLQEQLLVNQSAQAGLYQGLVSELFVTLPPLDEQQEIADYLDVKCAEIDRLIAKKEQLVKELEGYKKSLIYEVVTGKREVFH